MSDRLKAEEKEIRKAQKKAEKEQKRAEKAAKKAQKTAEKVPNIFLNVRSALGSKYFITICFKIL